MRRDDDDAKGIQSVEVGYEVLLAVQRGPDAVQLSEIARRVGLSTGAVHNYLVSLVRTGLVEQKGRGRYRLGPSAFALSLTSFQQLSGFDILRSEAHALHRLTGQSTAISVWSQGGPVSVFIERTEAHSHVYLRPGHVPLTRSAVGLIYAAYLPKSMMRDLIAHELGDKAPAEAPEAFIDRARAEVLPAGYARFANKEAKFFALSAPVITTDHRIAFALTLLVGDPASEEDEKTWRSALLNCAQRASLLIAGDRRLSISGPRIEANDEHAPST